MITQRRLQHLLALVEHAHFGRAASALDISQPALTKSIQALESELGVTLIDRKHGAVGPTAFGNWSSSAASECSPRKMNCAANSPFSRASRPDH